MGNVKGKGIETLPEKVAKEVGVDLNELSELIHEIKVDRLMKNSENLSYHEIKKLAIGLKK